MKILPLSNQYVHLEPYAKHHVSKTVEWLNKPFIQQTFGITHTITLEQHLAWLTKQENLLQWAINANDYIGNILLFLNLKHHSGYFQIYLGAELSTGKKVGYHSTILALDYAFNTLNLHRIWLHCHPENLPAIKLYTKLGFTFEGIERESIFKAGTYISQGRWSLLKSEWQERGQP